jgi:hypothetical protein
MLWNPRHLGALIFLAASLFQIGNPMPAQELSAVRRDVAAALAGRYLVTTLEGTKLENYVGGVEFLMDPAGRVRFKRLRHRDPVTGEMSVTLIEVTGVPAVLCRDRSPRDGKRLELSFTEERGQWRPALASVHLAADTLDLLMDLPAQSATDLGERQIDGKRARGIRFAMSLQASHTFWIDARTMLPLRAVLALTVDGKSGEVVERFDYPASTSIGRPAGVPVPDCV